MRLFVLDRALLAAALLAGTLAALLAPRRGAGQPTGPGTQMPPPGRVSSDAAAADVELLFGTLERVHPDLYATTPRDSVARRRAAVVAALPDSLSRPELWLRVAPLVAMLGDGHTSLHVPREEYRAAAAAGERVLPLRLMVDVAGRLRVAASADPAVGIGDEVVAIDGRSADSLLADAAATLSGEQVRWRRRNAAGILPVYLWMRGLRPPFDVALRRGDEAATAVVRLAGAREDSVAAAARARPGAAGGRATFEYRTLPGRVGYIDFRTMTGPPGPFADTVAAAFRRALADSVATLVIDLRRNGGGNSALGEILLRHVTDAPYRMTARKEWRMSAEYRDTLRARLRDTAATSARLVRAGDPQTRRLFEGPDGRVVTSESRVRSRGWAEPRFTGPVCVLVGPATFSSAMMLANAVKDFRLATLVGEETGGVPTSFGEVYAFRLPNSGLSAAVSTARFVRANGDATDRRGVLPDITVAPTPEDARAGRDPALEAARSCPARPGR